MIKIKDYFGLELELGKIVCLIKKYPLQSSEVADGRFLQ